MTSWAPSGVSTVSDMIHIILKELFWVKCTFTSDASTITFTCHTVFLHWVIVTAACVFQVAAQVDPSPGWLSWQQSVGFVGSVPSCGSVRCWVACCWSCRSLLSWRLLIQAGWHRSNLLRRCRRTKESDRRPTEARSRSGTNWTQSLHWERNRKVFLLSREIQHSAALQQWWNFQQLAAFYRKYHNKCNNMSETKQVVKQWNCIPEVTMAKNTTMEKHMNKRKRHFP